MKRLYGVLLLGCFGGLLYLASLVSTYAVSRAEAQIAAPPSSPSTLDVGGEGGGRAFFRSYAANTTPTEFTADDVVIGKTPLTGASSGAVFLRYDATNSVGFIGSLSPGSAWRDLKIGAGSLIVQNAAGTAQVTMGGVTNPGDITATDTITGQYLSAVGALSVNEIFDYGGNQSVVIGGAMADGATGIGVVLKSRNTYSTAGAKLVSFVNNTTEKGYVDKDGAMQLSGSKSRGTITLAAGTGTATVLSGAVCVCSDTTAVAAVQCAVASTTLTATGTGTDVIAYICL